MEGWRAAHQSITVLMASQNEVSLLKPREAHLFLHLPLQLMAVLITLKPSLASTIFVILVFLCHPSPQLRFQLDEAPTKKLHAESTA